MSTVEPAQCSPWDDSERAGVGAQEGSGGRGIWILAADSLVGHQKLTTLYSNHPPIKVKKEKGSVSA